MAERLETVNSLRENVKEIMNHFGEESEEGPMASPRAGALLLELAATQIGAPINFKESDKEAAASRGIFPRLIDALEVEYGLKTALRAVIQAEQNASNLELGALSDPLLTYIGDFKKRLLRKDFNNTVGSINFRILDELTEEDISDYRNQDD